MPDLQNIVSFLSINMSPQVVKRLFIKIDDSGDGRRCCVLPNTALPSPLPVIATQNCCSRDKESTDACLSGGVKPETSMKQYHDGIIQGLPSQIDSLCRHSSFKVTITIQCRSTRIADSKYLHNRKSSWYNDVAGPQQSSLQKNSSLGKIQLDEFLNFFSAIQNESDMKKKVESFADKKERVVYVYMGYFSLAGIGLTLSLIFQIWELAIVCGFMSRPGIYNMLLLSVGTELVGGRSGVGWEEVRLGTSGRAGIRHSVVGRVPVLGLIGVAPLTARREQNSWTGCTTSWELVLLVRGDGAAGGWDVVNKLEERVTNEFRPLASCPHRTVVLTT